MSACASFSKPVTKPTIAYQGPTIPDAMLTGEAFPAIPPIETMSDQDIAALMVKITAVGVGYRDRLFAVARIIRATGANGVAKPP